jgi:chitin disaccharide deacetylase
VDARCYTCGVRRLIVNADDFGLTAGVNRGVVEAHDRGVVSSTTLMANGSAAEEAIALAASRTQLSVGCHIQLVDGTPVAGRERLPSLVGASGAFRATFSQFASAALTGRIDEAEVEIEAAAQMRKLAAGGIQPSHFDTHKHVHMFPSVLRPLLRAARSCGIRALRNPFTPVAVLRLAPYVRRPRLWKRYSEVRVLQALSSKFKRMVAEAGLVTTDGTLGIVVTGALDQDIWGAIAGSLPEGTWEFVCHPGYNDADLEQVKTRLRASRVQELQVLTSPSARDVIRRNHVELISYRDLAG